MKTVIHRPKHDRKRNIADEPEMKELKRMIRAGELDRTRTVDFINQEPGTMKENEKQPTDKRITLRLPEDLHRKLKIKVAQEGTTITDVLLDLVQRYVGGIKNQKSAD